MIIDTEKLKKVLQVRDADIDWENESVYPLNMIKRIFLYDRGCIESVEKLALQLLED